MDFHLNAILALNISDTVKMRYIAKVTNTRYNGMVVTYMNEIGYAVHTALNEHEINIPTFCPDVKSLKLAIELRDEATAVAAKLDSVMQHIMHDDSISYIKKRDIMCKQVNAILGIQVLYKDDKTLLNNRVLTDIVNFDTGIYTHAKDISDFVSKLDVTSILNIWKCEKRINLLIAKVSLNSSTLMRNYTYLASTELLKLKMVLDDDTIEIPQISPCNRLFTYKNKTYTTYCMLGVIINILKREILNNPIEHYSMYGDIDAISTNDDFSKDDR